MRLLRFLQLVYVAVAVVVITLLGGWLMWLPGFSSGYRGAALRLLLFVVRYAATWAAVAWLIYVVDPEWFVASRMGLQTALQVLPAVVVAVFVLVLGSVAVIAQLASSTWGTRAPVMLTVDDRFQRAVVSPVLLLVVVLLFAGQVPDEPADPAAGVTAVVSALALATVALTFRSTALPVIVIRTIAPRNFPQFVVEDADRELSDGSTPLVVFRVGLLAEMLKMSLKREDSVAVFATLEAARQLHAVYLDALKHKPHIRDTRLDDGSLRTGWLAEDLVDGLVRAAEQALRDLASAAETDEITRTLGAVAKAFIEAGQHEDATQALRGLIQLGTAAHQVAPGAINFHGPPAEVLAQLEAVAEKKGESELAAHALAGWALSAAYPEYHFGVSRHPLWDRCIDDLGPSPPWQEAIALVRSPGWQAVWGNKQHWGPKPVEEVLERAQRQHAQRNGRGGRSLVSQAGRRRRSSKRRAVD